MNIGNIGVGSDTEIKDLGVAGAPPIGTVLRGTYRIVRPLAEGGFAEVYVAAHTRLRCEVAVKFLHRSLAANAEALSRFRQEAEITSALRHPHIVQIFDFNVTEQGVPFLVMELLDGQPLTSRVARGPFEPRAASAIIDQIAQALQAAHATGIVHRDLKPDNVILLAGDGGQDFVKVLDFGISQASWRPRITHEPLVAGTPEYMAPEQACALRDEIDPRTDQFSLAAMAYTLLTGREPFKGDDAIAVLYQVVHVVPPPPSQVAPWLGEEVDRVIGRGLCKRSVDRYPTITEFAMALGDAIDDGPPVRTPRPHPIRSSILDAPGPPAGLETARVIRRVRRKISGRRTGPVLMALAAAAAFAWFAPVTRRSTRAAWHRAGVEGRRMLAGPSAERPVPAAAVATP